MLVTATQIKIKSIIGFFRFIPRVKNIQEQLRKADGLIFHKFKGFRTFTGWENKEAMEAFRNNGHHVDAMKNIKKIGWSKSITWESQSEPDWHEAIEKLREVQF